MTPGEGDKKAAAAKSTKCAHPSCTCMLSAPGTYGTYCSEHCKEAGKITELRCGCQHAACR